MVFRQNRLARLSGRDGHVIWDVALADGHGGEETPTYLTNSAISMVMGGLDVLVLLEVNGLAGVVLRGRAISLRDGKTLWSHATPYHANRPPGLSAGDLDGDGRPEVVIRDQTPGGRQSQVAVTVLNGKDCSVRWNWLGGGFGGAIDQNSCRRLPGRPRRQRN